MYLIPQYMLFFSCSADKCISNCCRGWTIQIENSIVEKYKKLEDENLKNIILSSIGKDPGIPGIYGNMKLTQDFKCPLMQDGLCYIHKNLGESYLSKTCKTYPKHKNLIGNIKEISARISCPEVAKLVFFNNKPMEFEIIKDFGDIEITTLKIDSKSEIDYFWKLRMFTIEVLQYRKWDLNSRIKLLIMFYNKFNKEKSNIDVEINKFKAYLMDEKIYDTIKPIGADSKVKVELIKEILQINTKGMLLDIKYMNLLKIIVSGLKLDTDDIEESYSIFDNIKNRYYNNFFKDKEYMFENYLVNYVFQTLVPFGHDKNFFENIAIMVINLSVIKFMLIAMMAVKKDDFNEDDIIDIVHSFGRNFEHSEKFNKHLISIMKKKGLLNDKWLMLLLI